jgi:hypothetical protein
MIMRLSLPTGVFSLLLFSTFSCAGSSAGTGDGSPDATPDPVDIAETADDVEALDAPDGEAPLDTTSEACDECPDGLPCVDGVCIECEMDAQCDWPKWCKAGVCVESLCIPGTQACEENTPQECAEEGDSWLSEEPCVDSLCSAGECQPFICTPGEKQCGDLLLLVCTDQGTGWAEISCPPGQACVDSTCEPIDHNAVLIFDTSGSMGGGPDPFGGLLTPCICGAGNCPDAPYPACEDPTCPSTRLGVAKKVLNDLFDSTVLDLMKFAMMRFPQLTKATGTESCNGLNGIGHYVSTSNWMSGDNGAHVTPEESYFEDALHEILAVPYPDSPDVNNLAFARLWVDFNEVFELTEAPCQKSFECTPGVCAIDAGGGVDGVCGVHVNPELRASGGTPLGRSLFYAGEYIRKHVVVEGRPCSTANDCESAHYLCGPDSTCFDPLRDCRRTTLVLFTDGEEDPATEITDFFNPVIQAKRLHHGLGCAFDSDCLNGATCFGAICQDYPLDVTAPQGYPNLIDGQGANHLEDLRGDPISVTVHVVDISQNGGSPKNVAIAEHGGGKFHAVEDGAPTALFEAFKTTLDIKANLNECIPRFPEGYAAP